MCLAGVGVGLGVGVGVGLGVELDLFCAFFCLINSDLLTPMFLFCLSVSSAHVLLNSFLGIAIVVIKSVY